MRECFCPGKLFSMSEFELFCKEESAEIFFCGYPKLLEVHPKYCEKKLKGQTKFFFHLTFMPVFVLVSQILMLKRSINICSNMKKS